MQMKRILSEKGAVAVEFAVIAVLLLTLIFGAIDFGLLFYNKQVITNAAREGARMGIVQRIPTERVTVADVQNEVLSFCQNNLVTGSSNPADALEAPLVYYEDKDGNPVAGPGDTERGGIIGVEVRYTYDFFVISYLGIGPKLLKAEVKMTME
jgi:Flp pilus assembly protein TadG